MGRIPSPWELAGFLWLMHPAHTVRGEFPREFAARIKSILPSEALHPNTFLGRLRMRRDARKLAVAAAVVIAVQTWIDRQFADAGMGDSGGGHSKEYWSPGCSMILQLARETGWSEKDILDIPLTRLFQYQKITMRIHGDKTPLFNPSDRVLNLWLKDRNRTNN